MEENHTYRDRALRFVDLVTFDEGFPKVEGAVFENCTIRGPAVVLLDGGRLSNSRIAGELDALLWEIPPGRERIIGAVVARECTFERCSFEHIGFAGPPEQIQKLRQSLPPE